MITLVAIVQCGREKSGPDVESKEERPLWSSTADKIHSNIVIQLCSYTVIYLYSYIFIQLYSYMVT